MRKIMHFWLHALGPAMLGYVRLHHKETHLHICKGTQRSNGGLEEPKARDTKL